jgi:glycosyltransferase involved in cell wall biosynthesis
MVGSHPIISVVVPCYNAVATVSATIESALCQNVDLEVIILDDGSTDASADVIRSFGSTVRAEFGPNRGASAARDRGTALARGSYIQYVDADDLLVPGTLERRLTSLLRTDADVAYTDWQKMTRGANGSYELAEIIVPPASLIELDAEAACASSVFWAPPAALLYRRRVVERIGNWHRGLPVIQDARFLFDAAATGARFVHVPGVGAHYRIIAKSLSRRSRMQFIGDCFINAKEIEILWRGRGTLSVSRCEALKMMWAHVAIAAFREGMDEFGAARESYNRIAGHRPLIEAMWILRSILGPSRARNVEHAFREHSKRYRAVQRPLA